MRFFIKCLTILSILITCSITTAAAVQSPFSDVSETDWFYSSTMIALEADLLHKEGALLEPYQPASSAEIAKAIFDSQYIYVRLPRLGEPWYAPYLEAASSCIGYHISNRSLSRNETALLLYQVLLLPPAGHAAGFADANLAYLDSVKEAGLMGGKYIDGALTFCGESLLTNAELVAICANLLDYHDKLDCVHGFCPYYGAETRNGVFIPEATPLPQNPMTVESFEQVLDYVAVHDLDRIVLHYTIPYQESYRAHIQSILIDMVKRYRYEKPEYFNYLSRSSFSISRNSLDSFDVSIAWRPKDLSVSNGKTLRKEAFDQAASIYQNLYRSGQLSKSMTERQRAEILLDYVLDHTVYKDDGSTLCHTAWSVLFNGYGVCDGYSSAYQLLLRLDGINCWGRYGSIIQNGVSHHWTVASLDGQFLNIDATWCDGDSPDAVSSYFAITDEQLSKTHSW